MKVTGSTSFVLKENLRSLGSILRVWNKEVYGWVNLAVEEAVKIINLCNEKCVSTAVDTNAHGVIDIEAEGILIVMERKGVVESFWNNLRRRECVLK